MADLVAAYVGKQGAGKSHEAMKAVILPALKRRRHKKSGEMLPPRTVYSNVKGMRLDRIAAQLGVPEDDLTLHHVEPSDLLDDRNYTTLDDGPGVLFTGGCVLVVDEAHNIWPDTYRAQSNVQHPRRFRFIAEARHFTDGHGRTCQIVLATQNVKGLAAFVRQRIGTVYEFRNRGRLGKIFGRDYAKQYRITAYDYDDEKQLHRCTQLWTSTRKYDPAIWATYESSEGGGEIDFQSAAPGSSIWNIKFFLGIAAGLLALVFGFNWASTYFRTTCDAAPQSLVIDGPNVTARIGGKEVSDVLKVSAPDGATVFVRGRCAWRVGSGGGLEPTELRRSSRPSS